MGSLLLKEVSFHYFITVYCPPGDKVDVSSYVVGQDAPFAHGHPTKQIARRWLHCYLGLVSSFKHFSIVHCVYTKRPSVAPGCGVIKLLPSGEMMSGKENFRMRKSIFFHLCNIL